MLSAFLRFTRQLCFRGNSSHPELVGESALSSAENLKEQEQVQEEKQGFVSKLLALKELALPLKSWGETRDIIACILLASLLVNMMSLVFPLTLLQIYDRIIPNQSVSTLTWLVVAVAISVIIIVVMRLLRGYVSAWADAKFEHIIGLEAFKKIMQCNLMEYEREGTGKHLKRLNALNTMRDFYAGQLLVSIVDVPFIFIFMILIAYIAGWLVLVPIFMVLVLFTSALLGTSKMSHLLTSRLDHDNRRLNFIVETLSKIHTIKSNTMEAQMLRRFERLQKSSSLQDYHVTRSGSNMMSESMTLSQLSLAIVVALGSIMVFHGNLTVGGLAACTLLVGRSLQPVSSVISLWSRMEAVKIAREEFDKVLTMRPESNPGLKKVETLRGEIEFKQVDFQHDADSPLIFNDLSIKISPNETISIQGDSATGKSTFFWLLMNLIKPTKGSILLDGQDIMTLDPYSLRQNIGLMPEDAIIFQGTIMENLTMFCSELEEKALEASKKVGLAGIIQHLADGYDTLVGQQAVANLARGVAQRIVIARALVRDPSIILFDEANVALDMDSDNKVRTLLQELQGTCTIILISHRPSYLSLAQRKYVLEEGRLRLIL